MQEAPLQPQESLRIIQAMIGKTRAGISANSPYFLLWGWLTFSAILGQYALKVWLHYERHYQVWWVTIIGVIGSIIIGRRQERRRTVKSYVDDSVGYLWMALSIAFFTLTFVLALSKLGFENAYSFYILLYGIGTMVTGCLIRFTPLIVGGCCCWVLSAATAFTGFDADMLLAATAILVSYIIPGHLLRLKKS
jgi:hypothetical protein